MTDESNAPYQELSFNETEPGIAQKPAAITPTGASKQSEESMYIGLSQADAEALAIDNGKEFRVSSVDGVGFIFRAADKNPNRVNFTIEKDIVTQVHFG